MTINGARGFNRKIADRLDLTLECIRRYYLDKPSPLYETFKIYHEFFDLFENFKGYVDFFLFQDWVLDDYSSVKIAGEFGDFNSSPVPSSIKEYEIYSRQMIRLVNLRNKKIEVYNNGMV